MTAVALVEFFELLRKSGMNPMPGLGIPLGMFFLFAAYKVPDVSFQLSVSVAVLSVLCLQFARAVRGGIKHTIADISVTVFGSIYVGALLSFVFNLKDLYTDYYSKVYAYNVLAMLPLMCGWACDAGALFSGKAVGRTPFVPKISPNKTIEGAVGGLSASVAMSVLLCSLLKIGVGHALAIGLLNGVFGQVGDLSESAFKREVQVKDTGSLIIGAGGVLDRADSILFTLPVTFIYLKLFVVS